MGKPFMPHQQMMADVALEVDPATGLLCYGEVVIIGPRQATGKTEFLLPYMTHRCVARWENGPQSVLYTAQTADKAREKWRDIHLERILASSLRAELLKPRDEYGGARLRLNQEAMWWKNGSVWRPGSTTGKTAGTGDTLDLAVIDEAWSKENARTELGLKPAMMTRHWAQFLITSMIPGVSRAAPGTWPYLAAKRQVGRARVEADVRRGTAFFDFTAEEGADPGHPDTWWSCLPGLGRTVQESTVQADYESMAERGLLIDFCAEYLGWEPEAKAPRWTLIRYDTWKGLHDPASQIAHRLAFSAEISESRTSGVICAAGRRPDGHWHGEVIEPGGRLDIGTMGTSWMLARMVQMTVEQKPSCWVIDPRRPGASLIVPLRNALAEHNLAVPVLTPNTLDVAGACGRFYDATGDQERAGDDGVRIFHLGQPELDRSLAGARRLDQGSAGAFTFVKRGSAAELMQLYGVVLAMQGSDVHGVDDYDITESVDGGRPCLRCDRSLYGHDEIQPDGATVRQWLHAADDTPECS